MATTGVLEIIRTRGKLCNVAIITNPPISENIWMIIIKKIDTKVFTINAALFWLSYVGLFVVMPMLISTAPAVDQYV